MSKPNALLIGAGYFGKILLPYIHKHCRLQAIATRSTKDLPALLAQSQLAFIATPLDSHFDLACAALEAGCHVFLEKPATRTARELHTLLHLATEAGRALFVDYPYTFSPSIRYALLLCQELESIHASFLQYGRFYEGEGVLEVLGVHYLSVFALMQELGILSDLHVCGCELLSNGLRARVSLRARQGGRQIPISLHCSLQSPRRKRLLALQARKWDLQVDSLSLTPLAFTPSPLPQKSKRESKGESKRESRLDSRDSLRASLHSPPRTSLPQEAAKIRHSEILPIFSEGENLAHVLAAFCSFSTCSSLESHAPYALHRAICASTATLLDSAQGLGGQ